MKSRCMAEPEDRFMRGNVSFKHVLEVPRQTLTDVKRRRDSNQLFGKIIIDDTGSPTVRIECELEADLALLVVLHAA
jgi:hypothetical protein